MTLQDLTTGTLRAAAMLHVANMESASTPLHRKQASSEAITEINGERQRRAITTIRTLSDQFRADYYERGWSMD